MNSYDYSWQKELDEKYASEFTKAIEEWRQEGKRRPLRYYLDYWEYKHEDDWEKKEMEESEKRRWSSM